MKSLQIFAENYTINQWKSASCATGRSTQFVGN